MPRTVAASPDDRTAIERLVRALRSGAEVNFAGTPFALTAEERQLMLLALVGDQLEFRAKDAGVSGRSLHLLLKLLVPAALAGLPQLWLRPSDHGFDPSSHPNKAQAPNTVMVSRILQYRATLARAFPELTEPELAERIALARPWCDARGRKSKHPTLVAAIMVFWVLLDRAGVKGKKRERLAYDLALYAAANRKGAKEELPALRASGQRELFVRRLLRRDRDRALASERYDYAAAVMAGVAREPAQRDAAGSARNKTGPI
jgi:hypothetical protein